MTADTLIYNLYRALYDADYDYGNYNSLLAQSAKYLEERNLLDTNEED